MDTKIGRLTHVAIAVPDIAAASRTYRDLLGATVTSPADSAEHGVTAAFVELPNSRIELLQPYGEASPVAKFLRRHPAGGIHHICLEVEDIRAARDALVAKGAHVIGDGEPKLGANRRPVMFLEPADFCGTLLELEESEAGHQR